jgi:uncharacterized protein (DUF2132 family)
MDLYVVNITVIQGLLKIGCFFFMASVASSRAFLRIFPWGGGRFFEKGPFCEIIY